MSAQQMPDQPLVSIVTPSFNQGQYIEQTILSVLDQDYPRIEYMVMDGGSTDGTLDVLRRYDDRLVWFSEPDRGQSHAINKGWQRSQGDILAWLNSDDFYEPGAVQVLVEQFSAHPEAAVVYGDAAYVDASGEFLRKASIESSLLPKILVTNVVGQPNAFVARWAVEEIGLLDESLHYVMDYEFWLRMLGRFQFVHVPKVIANARIHDECKTWGQADQHLSECITLLQRFYSSTSVPAWAVRYRAKAVGYWYTALGSYWAQQGKYRLAAKNFYQAVIRDPRYARSRGVWMAFLWAILGDSLAAQTRRWLGRTPASQSQTLPPPSSDPFEELCANWGP